MSWATVWRTLIREDALRTQIKTDPHSPGTTRAIQPLKNVDAFYEAFNIQEGDGISKPEERVGYGNIKKRFLTAFFMSNL